MLTFFKRDAIMMYDDELWLMEARALFMYSWYWRDNATVALLCVSPLAVVNEPTLDARLSIHK